MNNINPPETPSAAGCRRQLAQLVAAHGPEILDDSRRVRAMLADSGSRSGGGNQSHRLGAEFWCCGTSETRRGSQSYWPRNSSEPARFSLMMLAG